MLCRQLFNDKKDGAAGYKILERLNLLKILETDTDWVITMFEKSKDLDNVFADIANGQSVVRFVLTWADGCLTSGKT